MTWWIALFASRQDAEAIVGDLDEEWRSIARRDGQRRAWRWYRRQVLRTVAHLAVSPVRQSPMTFMALGLLGFALVWPLTQAAWWLAGQIVVRGPVYAYIPATLFWQATSVVPHLAVGALAAWCMGSRAMPTALAVVMTMVVWVVAINPLLLARALPPEHVPGMRDYLARALPALSMYGLSVLSAAALGVTVRQRRAARESVARMS